MNDGNVKPVRPIPLMLVLLVLAVSIFSDLIHHGIGSIYYRWTSLATLRDRVPYGLVIIASEELHFPFTATIVLWLASRSGRTSWSTWFVPFAMLVALGIPSLRLVLRLFLSFMNDVWYSSLSEHIVSIWQNVFRRNINTYVFLAFAFRLSTLHLRPVDSTASVHRLSVTILMLLTGTIAVMLSLDVAANRWVQSYPENLFFANESLTRFWFLLSVLHEFNSAMLWFSIAWLMVARNAMRWIGVLGLSIHWIIDGLYCFVFLPLYLNQLQASFLAMFSPGFISMYRFEIWYFAGRFAVSIVHDVMTIACFGIIHVAGYRWDIHRPLPKEQVAFEQNADAIPPVLATRS